MPQKKMGKKTIDDNAPGSFLDIGTISADGQSATITINNVVKTADGKIYVAVHAVLVSSQ